MSKIRSKNTTPELTVRRYLHKNGFRFRLHSRILPGKPDIVMPKFKTVIFINGCFWHGHDNCRLFKLPGTNTEWWKQKIFRTREKDSSNYKLLKSQGWDVEIVWECGLKSDSKEITLSHLKEKLNSKKTK